MASSDHTFGTVRAVFEPDAIPVEDRVATEDSVAHKALNHEAESACKQAVGPGSANSQSTQEQAAPREVWIQNWLEDTAPYQSLPQRSDSFHTARSISRSFDCVMPTLARSTVEKWIEGTASYLNLSQELKSGHKAETQTSNGEELPLRSTRADPVPLQDADAEQQMQTEVAPKVTQSGDIDSKLWTQDGESSKGKSRDAARPIRRNRPTLGPESRRAAIIRSGSEPLTPPWI